MPDQFNFLPPKDSNLDHSPIRRFTPTPHPDTFINHYSHAKPGIWPFPDRLHVVMVMSNPIRWRSRYELFRATEKRVNDAGAVLWLTEAAFGDRHFEVTDPNNPQHLQLRTQHELWLKERMINLTIQRMPPECKYIAWIDADVQFVRPDWAQETLHLLQHYDFLQMFSHAQDLGPDLEPISSTPGFIYRYLKSRPAPHEMTDRFDFDTQVITDTGNAGGGVPQIIQTEGEKITVSDGCGYYGDEIVAGPGKLSWKFSHPGFAWAARRDALDKVGGLIDIAILGSGDYHMATALVGDVYRSLPKSTPARYKEQCALWAERATKHILHEGRSVGYVPGLINHFWHGKRAARLYDHRWKFLNKMGFDPDRDLKVDTQGLWQLTERNWLLRDGLRDYNRRRNEDSIDV